jgi:hypothetical protein
MFRSDSGFLPYEYRFQLFFGGVMLEIALDTATVPFADICAGVSINTKTFFMLRSTLTAQADNSKLAGSASSNLTDSLRIKPVCHRRPLPPEPSAYPETGISGP